MKKRTKATRQFDWGSLIGKKIFALRGFRHTKYGKSRVGISYILFDDKKTYLELSEQDPCDYHDCCSSARTLELRQDAEVWKRLYKQEKGWKGKPWVEETTDLQFPF